MFMWNFDRQVGLATQESFIIIQLPFNPIKRRKEEEEIRRKEEEKLPQNFDLLSLSFSQRPWLNMMQSGSAKPAGLSCALPSEKIKWERR